METDVGLLTPNEDEAWNFAVALLTDDPTPSRLIASFGPELELRSDMSRAGAPNTKLAIAQP